MAERSIIDQLDDAITAAVEARQLDVANFDAELSALFEVAQDLIGLPRETFKAELQQQLIRRDSMSSPEQQVETTPEESARDSYEAGKRAKHETRKPTRGHSIHHRPQTGGTHRLRNSRIRCDRAFPRNGFGRRNARRTINR